MGRLSRFKIDWFLIGLGVATALAWLFPGPGAEGGWMHPEILTKAGVALIFFLHGLALSFAALKSGALKWRLHLVVQLCTFLFFPLLGILLLWLAGDHVAGNLRTGIFYLCALPSTVSSSIAMTAAARGNVPAAVFNATLSSMIGVVLTPLWMSWLLKTGGHSLPLGPVILDLVLWLVLPLVAGQALRPLLGAWAGRNKSLINKVDRGTILLLVYTSFCDSVKWGVWSEHGWLTLVFAVVVAGAVFYAVLFATGAVCNRLGFTPPDRIAAVFCGSKKSLASGVPMAQIIFAGNPGLGMILLPIMIYHPLQLIICGALAGRWAKREGE
ncbi:bile acid:sodium symporter [Termitidicoccus mucosus]|uniref:Bile acid:sodium symporter n=1 Tax=Termitidicoccus mucosus TaxID=1184151 RepID=A0A178IC60_9BACT|nr:bile acid:sodium symporter [Opitutaceae bacterium TSB47]